MLYGIIKLVDQGDKEHVIQFGFGEITTCPLLPPSIDDEDFSNDQEDHKIFDNNFRSDIKDYTISTFSAHEAWLNNHGYFDQCYSKKS
jgi:hypothetical protein